MPAVAISVASPAHAASPAATISIDNIPPATSPSVEIATATVTVTGNAGLPVTVTLPAGFSWTDGSSDYARVIGTGPGVHPVPSFQTSASQSRGSLIATSGGLTAVALIEVIGGLYSMSVIGGMDIITRGPDEFRADLIAIVPQGVRPQKMWYRFEPNGTGSEMEMKETTGDIRREIDEFFKVMHVQTIDDATERLYISCRGDANIAVLPTAVYQWPIRALWTDGNASATTFPILNQHTGNDGRPVAINAWDVTTAGLPGYVSSLRSQAAWGNLVAEGSSDTLDGNLFHVDAAASGRSAAIGNDLTTSAYFQFVHEDGTPASVTPTPRSVSFASHSAYAAPGGLLLGKELGSSFTLDKSGYWKLLIWPQSSNSLSTLAVSSDGVAWDPTTDPGHQVGSVFWKLPANA